ncbi:MAG TPA: MoxR family ATPase [Thermoanaerobaculia bacterium]|jgi:MoxR-like ATPase|nr:MoxR family ATPase [Thermoanaerobaculia bacterium]
METSHAHETLSRLRKEVGRVVIGQDAIVNRLLIALLIRGHVLVEGLPGLAKTLLVKTLAQAIDGTFKRIQFTPDLLPADITGTQIFDPAGRTFNARLGPIFANFILADEINRAPAKVQSALLEAMQERQVTIGDTSYALPEPFVVIATQNPIEHEGTYNLPEAQVDRFVMKLRVDYPTAAEELRMLGLYLDPTKEAVVVQRVLTLDEIRAIAQLAARVHTDERIGRYIVQVVTATRKPADYRLPSLTGHIAFGASPRATLALAHVAKAHAFLEGRDYVVPEDVKAVAHDVLRHRLVLSYEAAAESMTADRIVEQILGAVAVP